MIVRIADITHDLAGGNAASCQRAAKTHGPRLRTVAGASRQLGVTPSAVYDLVKRGVLHRRGADADFFGRLAKSEIDAHMPECLTDWPIAI